MAQLIRTLENPKLFQLFSHLITHPSQEFTHTLLMQQTRLAKATLTKWLAWLEQEELISARQLGRNKLYSVKREHYLVKQLKILLNLLSLDFLAQLTRLNGFEAYLFGSSARGEDREDSDIDILILGNLKKEEIWPKIHESAPNLGKELRLQVFSKGDWLALAEKDPAFYERVEKDKILIQ